MKEKISLLPALFAALAAIFLTWLLGAVLVERGMGEFQVNLERHAESLAQEHRKANLLGALTALAGVDENLRATVAGRLPPDNPAVLEKMRYLFKALDLDNILIIAPDGVVKAYMAKGVKTSLTGKSLAWRPYFIGAMSGQPSMYAALGSNTRERGFYIAVPIPSVQGGAGAPAGALVAKLGFDEIDQGLQQEKHPLAVLSPEGVVFASNVPGWRYQALGGAEEVARAQVDKRVNNAYKDAAPRLIALDAAGWIKKDGQKLRRFSASIAWPDHSGQWQLAGFIGYESLFGWPARVFCALTLFFVFLLIHAWLRSRRRAQDKTAQVVSLLDNSGEGFLSFGADLRIDSEYSRACESMLGAVPENQDVASLLFGEASPRAQLLRETVAAVLASEDAEIGASMLSLLPKEIQRAERVLAVAYRRIGREKFMVVLDDITEARQMADLLELEQKHLKMVVLAISDSRNFFEMLDGFAEFLTAENAVASADACISRAELRRLYREVHTYKGLFAQFAFSEMPAALHRLESQLAGQLADSEGSEVCEPPGVLDWQMLKNAFAADKKIVSDALGEAFLKQGRALHLSEAQALRLEALSVSLLRGEPVDVGLAEVRALLDDIVRLRKLRLSDALQGYDRLLQQTAQRQEKLVQPLQVEGGEGVWIDPVYWKGFLQSLVHVFRNAVTHGLESPETRWENDKDEAGAIHCRIRYAAGQLYLNIADDGAGLNLPALRAKAAENGVPEAQTLDDEKAAALVFMDHVSTYAQLNDLAGRGVGLAAVRQAVLTLGGQVAVRSCPGAGTEFEFILPFDERAGVIEHA